jgi:cytoskeletal protein CcmA (bactofilin family)
MSVFGKKEEASFEKVDTLIGKDTIFEGNLNAKGTLRIDGKVIGEINCQGDLVVGDNGIIEAGIKARHILVAGSIKGDISAQGKVELASTGNIKGDINVASLIIDDGGILEGNCSMQNSSNVKNKEEKL